MTSNKERVLELIKEEKYAAQIARQLGISKARVSQIIKELIAEGKLSAQDQITVFKEYSVPFGVKSELSFGVKSLNSSSDDKLNSAHITQDKPLTSSKPKLRLHRQYRTYELAQAIDPSSKSGIGSINYINNTSQALGEKYNVTIRFTTQHLCIEGFELYGDLAQPAPELRLEALSISRAIALQVELESLVKLKRDETGNLVESGDLVEVEIQNHSMAQPIDQKGIIPLYWNKETGKVEVWTDKSYGLDNLESNRIFYIEKLRLFTKDILDNNAWEQMKANQLALSSTVKEYGEKLNAHIPYFEEAARLNQAFMQELKALKEPPQKPLGFWTRLIKAIK